MNLLYELTHGSHQTWKTWKTPAKKITLENSWKTPGKMTSLWKNEILSQNYQNWLIFQKKRLRRAKIDWILEPFPKNFRLRLAT